MRLEHGVQRHCFFAQRRVFQVAALRKHAYASFHRTIRCGRLSGLAQKVVNACIAAQQPPKAVVNRAEWKLPWHMLRLSSYSNAIALQALAAYNEAAPRSCYVIASSTDGTTTLRG